MDDDGTKDDGTKDDGKRGDGAAGRRSEKIRKATWGKKERRWGKCVTEPKEPLLLHTHNYTYYRYV